MYSGEAGLWERCFWIYWMLQIYVSHLFIDNVRASSALLSSIAKQRGESPQAKVIVVLFRQLLYCQRIQSEYLLSQHLREREQERDYKWNIMSFWTKYNEIAWTDSLKLHSQSINILKVKMNKQGRKKKLGWELIWFVENWFDCEKFHSKTRNMR